MNGPVLPNATSVMAKDEGGRLPRKMQQLADAKPNGRGVLALDQQCLSCTKMQADIIKQFKIACLVYAPSPVIYRNV